MVQPLHTNHFLTQIHIINSKMSMAILSQMESTHQFYGTGVKIQKILKVKSLLDFFSTGYLGGMVMEIKLN